MMQTKANRPGHLARAGRSVTLLIVATYVRHKPNVRLLATTVRPDDEECFNVATVDTAVDVDVGATD